MVIVQACLCSLRHCYVTGITATPLCNVTVTSHPLTSSTNNIASLLPPVSENLDVNTFVAHISVEDLDSGSNGDVNCSLSDSHFRLEEIFAKQYKMTTAVVLDREILAEYNLDLRCHDFGGQPLRSSQRLKVRNGRGQEV